MILNPEALKPRRNSNKKSYAIALFLLLFLAACQKEGGLSYPLKIRQLIPEKASELSELIRSSVSVELADDLELTLWASDSLVSDPIAISVDPSGRIFYTQGMRIANSEFDIRGHQDWMTASISFETVEDRRAFLRKTFEAENDASVKFLKDLNNDGVRDWKDLTVEKEQVWFVSDQSGDGVADYAQMYLEDFHEEITDLANGVEYSYGDVYISVGPDLWKTRDSDGDGIADKKESISHGFAVHIGFGAHGMSGVTRGPDGRIWWGIGDIGMNVIDKEGKQWKYPNRGVVVRSEPDGSNFEVFAMGVRNTHEFTFDKYGNLISEDNDGDHDGERERLVYLIDGSDSGWRINWQFGKYTDPDNNDYKVWMDEKMSIPRWDGQAAYFLPPIQNYVNGPTGFVYNPGTALGPEWYEHFFVAEFRGTASSSPIHAFTLKSDGAGFALDSTREIVKGLLPTGLDFGPDGALYFGDWITGWGAKNEGRIWKLDVPGGASTDIRKEVKQLIELDFKEKKENELAALLAHQDMRIRTKAQFELVNRKANGTKIFKSTAASAKEQLARIHALWGIAQQARKQDALAAELGVYLSDEDPEITAQAARMIGDVKHKGFSRELIGLLQHPSPRVRFFATEALGRIEEREAVPAILKMLRLNDDQDTWLRMAGMIALGRINDAESMIALSGDPSRAVRTAAVVALRRMSHPGIVAFLADKDEYIVAEAARAINDDYSIPEAIPDLASHLKETNFRGEAFLRRAINANLRNGKEENAADLMSYARRTDAPADMRAEALLALSTWAKPSLHDRVDGRYRDLGIRDAAGSKKLVEENMEFLLSDENEKLRLACIAAIRKFSLGAAAEKLFARLKSDPSDECRALSLSVLFELQSKQIMDATAIALADKSQIVRAKALEILPKTGLDESRALPLFLKIMETASMEEKQAALSAAADFNSDKAADFLSEFLNQYLNGTLAAELHLDLVEAVEKSGNNALKDRLHKYQEVLLESNPFALFEVALFGGNRRKGGDIFYNHEGAQCTRCHSIWEVGGNAGPGLIGVGSRLSRKEILYSLIDPSRVLAGGFEVADFRLKDGSELSGIVLERSESEVIVKLGKDDIRTISKKQIASSESMPSSMPGVKDILSKHEIRDLVAFLERLKSRD